MSSPIVPPSPVEDGLAEVRFLAMIGKASPDAIFIYDESGRFFYANDEACQMTGFARAELLRMQVTDIERDFSLAQLQARWSTLQAGESSTVFGRHHRKDGSEYGDRHQAGDVE